MRFRYTLPYCLIPALLGFLWLISPTDSYAASLPQEGTLPTPTATVVPLRITTYTVRPPTVVAGDDFTIAFQIQSTGVLDIRDVVIGIEDRQTNWELYEPGGDKRIFLYNLGTEPSDLVSVTLRYDINIVGTRQLVFVMEYIYIQNGERSLGVYRDSILLEVVTPTPTPTFTPTPTWTPTPSHTPTYTPIPTPVPPIIIITTVPVIVTPTPIPDNGNTESSGSSVSEPDMGVEDPSGGESQQEMTSLPVILQFKAQNTLSPGQKFLIEYVAQNVSDQPLTDLLITWQGCDVMGMAPVGGGQWYINQLQSRGPYMASIELFVAASAPDGIYTCELQATSVSQNEFAPRTAKVYFWVDRSSQADATSTPIPTPTLSPSPIVESIEEVAAEAQETFWQWFFRLLLGR